MKKFEAGGRALDVGSGSGYLTACLARANRQTSQSDKEKIVVGIEHIPELVELGKKNINADDPTLFTDGDIEIIGKWWRQRNLHSIIVRDLTECIIFELAEGDGRLGYEKYAPYDVIHVTIHFITSFSFKKS